MIQFFHPISHFVFDALIEFADKHGWRAETRCNNKLIYTPDGRLYFNAVYKVYGYALTTGRVNTNTLEELFKFIATDGQQDPDLTIANYLFYSDPDVGITVKSKEPAGLKFTIPNDTLKRIYNAILVRGDIAHKYYFPKRVINLSINNKQVLLDYAKKFGWRIDTCAYNANCTALWFSPAKHIEDATGACSGLTACPFKSIFDVLADVPWSTYYKLPQIKDMDVHIKPNGNVQVGCAHFQYRDVVNIYNAQFCTEDKY